MQFWGSYLTTTQNTKHEKKYVIEVPYKRNSQS